MSQTYLTQTEDSEDDVSALSKLESQAKDMWPLLLNGSPIPYDVALKHRNLFEISQSEWDELKNTFITLNELTIPITPSQHFKPNLHHVLLSMQCFNNFSISDSFTVRNPPKDASDTLKYKAASRLGEMKLLQILAFDTQNHADFKELIPKAHTYYKNDYEPLVAKRNLGSEQGLDLYAACARLEKDYFGSSAIDFTKIHSAVLNDVLHFDLLRARKIEGFY
jgi:hypothetical protein